MAECLGLCDYVDEVCQGCGRDFSLYAEEEKAEAAPDETVKEKHASS